MKRLIQRRKVICSATCLLLISIAASSFAAGDLSTPQKSVDFELETAVDNEVLGGMRGGFVIDDGVKVDIGINKAFYIDGVLQVEKSLQANDVSLLNKGLGALVSGDHQIGNSLLNSVIQNNLDGKTIRNELVYEVNVRNLNVEHLQNGLLESARGQGLRDIQVLR
jgi:hypothetical protein